MAWAGKTRRRRKAVCRILKIVDTRNLCRITWLSSLFLGSHLNRKFWLKFTRRLSSFRALFSLSACTYSRILKEKGSRSWGFSNIRYSLWNLTDFYRFWCLYLGPIFVILLFCCFSFVFVGTEATILLINLFVLDRSFFCWASAFHLFITRLAFIVGSCFCIHGEQSELPLGFISGRYHGKICPKCVLIRPTEVRPSVLIKCETTFVCKKNYSNGISVKTKQEHITHKTHTYTQDAHAHRWSKRCRAENKNT